MSATHFIQFKSNVEDDYVATEELPPGKATMEKVLASQSLVVASEVTQLQFYGWDACLVLAGKYKIYCYLDPNPDLWFIGFRRKKGISDLFRRDEFDINSFCNDFSKSMKSIPELEDVSKVLSNAEIDFVPRNLSNVDTYFFAPALDLDDCVKSIKENFPEANINTSGKFIGDVRVKIDPEKRSSVFFYYDVDIKDFGLSDIEEEFLKSHFNNENISAVHIRDQEAPEFEQYRRSLAKHLKVNLKAIHRKEIRLG